MITKKSSAVRHSTPLESAFPVRLLARWLPPSTIKGSARSLHTLILLFALVFTMASQPVVGAQSVDGVTPGAIPQCPASSPVQVELIGSDGMLQGLPTFTMTPSNGKPFQISAGYMDGNKVGSFYIKGKLYVWDGAHKCYFHEDEIKVYEFYKNDGGGYTYELVNGMSGFVYETGTLVQN